MSGFFGGILGQLGGLLGGQGAAQTGAAGLLGEVINAAGGPAGIMQKFEQAGMGEKVQSWIGSGHNLPISAEQITQVFPPAELDGLAQKFGLPAGVASEVLAQLLPHAIDHSTPGGALPSQTTPATAGDAAPADSPNFDFAGMIGRLAEPK